MNKFWILKVLSLVVPKPIVGSYKLSCFDHIHQYLRRVALFGSNVGVPLLTICLSFHYKRMECFKWAFKYSPRDKILSNDLYGDFQ